jgi:hypothetical protein
VSCEQCEEDRETDGDIPACETDKGCIIPPLGEYESRIMGLRTRLVMLKDLADPKDVLAAQGATLEEIDLIAEVERIVEKLQPKNNG